jgi:peptidoglycan/xylan/chitin deacetylase (PgdA/CDA1 family)
MTVKTRLRDWWAAAGPILGRRVFDSLLWRLPDHTARTAALTFDDGPHPASTPRLLEVLGRWGLPATFFVIGEQAQRYPELVREILAAGHEVGNHSWSHRDPWRLARRDMVREFRDTARLLVELTGHAPKWLRPPFGHFSLAQIAWCRRVGIRPVMWDTVANDYHPEAVATLSRQLLTRIHAGSVILLHDNAIAATQTPAMLEVSLPRLIDAGWTFQPLPVAARWTPARCDKVS